MDHTAITMTSDHIIATITKDTIVPFDITVEFVTPLGALLTLPTMW
jgi:hypothetical protein